MNIIKAITKRGLELKGAIYGDNSNDTVLIMMTGISSNVFQNDLLDATGKLLSQNGITTIIGHASDSFSCFSYTDRSTGRPRFTGTFDADFDVVYEDVETWVLKAKDMGFKRIILGGHSLGSNKIINYLGNTKDDYIDYYIVSAPIDIMHWKTVMPNVDESFSMAQSWVKTGRGDDILPMLFGGFSPMTANTVLGFFNAENLKNCPVLSGEGETNSLYNIKPNGTFIIGSKDSVTGDSPKEFMEQLNKWTKNPNANQVIEIEGASHIFFGKHDIYAETILNCIKNHFQKTKVYREII